MQNALTLVEKLRKEFSNGSMKESKKTLDELKIVLATLNLLLPQGQDQKELLIASNTSNNARRDSRDGCIDISCISRCSCV